jgi:hypothetical protein
MKRRFSMPVINILATVFLFGALLEPELNSAVEAGMETMRQHFRWTSYTSRAVTTFEGVYHVMHRVRVSKTYSSNNPDVRTNTLTVVRVTNPIKAKSTGWNLARIEEYQGGPLVTVCSGQNWPDECTAFQITRSGGREIFTEAITTDEKDVARKKLTLLTQSFLDEVHMAGIQAPIKEVEENLPRQRGDPHSFLAVSGFRRWYGCGIEFSRPSFFYQKTLRFHGESFSLDQFKRIPPHFVHAFVGTSRGGLILRMY